MPFIPSGDAPEVRSLCSAGITRLLRSYGPLRHRRDRTWPSRVVRCGCHRRRHRLPVLPVRSFDTCHRLYPGGPAECICRWLLPQRWPSPCTRRIGVHIIRFGASSIVHLCYGLHLRGVARATLSTEGSDEFVTSPAASIATGHATPPRQDSHLRKRTSLHGAHERMYIISMPSI